MKNSVNVSLILSVSLMSILFFLRCSEDEGDRYSSYVNFQVNINEARYSDLQTSNNAIIVKDEVYGENQTRFGVIIYRDVAGEFHAYDRLCMYGKNDSPCAVELSSDASIAECPCCGSRYILSSEGDPISGPAEAPLLQYKTNFDGNKLTVRGNY